MMKKIIRSLGAILLAFAPLSVFAVRAPEDFRGIVNLFIDLILEAIPVVFGIAVLVFVWGLAKFILKAGDESAREEGKQVMKWGIVALVVMVSLWGIVLLVSGEFNIAPLHNGLPLLPQ